MMQVIVMCNSLGDQDKEMGGWIVLVTRLLCMRATVSEARIRSHVPGEEGDSWCLYVERANAV